MSEVWDFELCAMQNSPKFEGCIMLGCLSPQPFHYHDNLLLSLSFSLLYKLLSYLSKYVTCKSTFHCAFIFYLHSLKRLASFINIIPSSKCRLPSSTFKVHLKEGQLSFIPQCLSPSAHIYHHFGNVEIFIGTNTNFAYMYIVWSRTCVDLGCTSHLWLHQFVNLAFILSDISTMNVVPKTLPFQREMYSSMLEQATILSKIIRSPTFPSLTSSPIFLVVLCFNYAQQHP